MTARRNDEDVTKIISNCPLTYKIVVCPEFLNDNPGFFFFRTNNTHKHAALLCGDMAISLGLDSDWGMDFLGLQSQFLVAPANKGYNFEERQIVATQVFSQANSELIEMFKWERINVEKKMLNDYWRDLQLPGEMSLSIQQEIMYNLYREKLKLGDKCNNDIKALIIREIIEKHLNNKV